MVQIGIVNWFVRVENLKRFNYLNFTTIQPVKDLYKCLNYDPLNEGFLLSNKS